MERGPDMSDSKLYSEGDRIPITIEEELRSSYLDYAMSVIIGRALPDARDGLKPVHRRILYGMWDVGNTSTKGYKKSARTVGDVMGRFHPHGDAAIYDTAVRMAQPFSMRYPLVDGQGNFGSVDGDPAAAMRYTEIRLRRLAEEMLGDDIGKETVDWAPNYDGSLEEPLVLPAAFPNLLVNGSSGIAVGMATNIPPHNLRECIDATIHLIRNPEANLAELMQLLPGPDFPTGGYILGLRGIAEAYATGRGIVQMRARATIEEAERGTRDAIIVHELPYQVNKARLVEQIAALVHGKRLEGIADLRDESDRDGIRVVVELKRDAVPEVVLNNLFKLTQMQTTFGIILLAVLNNQPKVFELRRLLSEFIDHRREVVIRRTRYDLAKAKDRAHVLEGLVVALDNIDEVIALVRKAPDPSAARAALIDRFGLSDRQAQAILDIVVEELESIRDRYGDDRRTEIISDPGEILLEDLIADEEMVITVSRGGYIKRSALTAYRAQRRGGRGRRGMATKEEDEVWKLLVASTHATVLFFTTAGRVFARKVHELPDVGPSARGRALVNLLPLDAGERVATLLAVRDFAEHEDAYLLFATRKGKVKRTPLAAYSNIRAVGLRAVSIMEGDDLLSVHLTRGDSHIFMGTHHGMGIRFEEGNARPMGRVSSGVRGINLRDGDWVEEVATFDPSEEKDILVVTDLGYGKRTPVSEFRVQSRGGYGTRLIRLTDKNGMVAGIRHVSEDDQVLLVTERGMLIRMEVEEIRRIGRSTQGVRVIRLDTDDRVVSVAKLVDSNGDDEEVAGEHDPSPEIGDGADDTTGA